MTPDEFVDRWKESAGAKLANSQSFLKKLCDLLDVPQPDPTRDDAASNQYLFEKAVEFINGHGAVTRANKSQVTELLETLAAVGNIRQLDDGRFTVFQ